MHTPSLFDTSESDPCKPAPPVAVKEKRKPRKNMFTSLPGVSRKQRDRCFEYVVDIMIERLERLFMDEYREELASRYRLNDEDLNDLLYDLQLMFFPGRFDDPNLSNKGLVPHNAASMSPAALVVAADVIREAGGVVPGLSHDPAEEFLRRRVAEQEARQRYRDHATKSA